MRITLGDYEGLATCPTDVSDLHWKLGFSPEDPRNLQLEKRVKIGLLATAIPTRHRRMKRNRNRIEVSIKVRPRQVK